ncbi:hypothetical protein [Paenibacillus sp. TC-CSREp1]
MLLKNDVDIRDVKELMGHSSIETTMIIRTLRMKRRTELWQP